MSDRNHLALANQSRGSGDALTVERLAEPEPGQYWRAKHDIVGRHDSRGKYNGVAAGTVLVLKNIEQASGEAHVIVLAPHPSLPNSYQVDLRIHADDFEKDWERALDGEAVRARELAQLVEEMRLTQEAMSRGPAEAPKPVAIGQQPALNAGGATGRELATAEGLQAVTARAEEVKALADSQLAWINQHSNDLGAQAGAMARFHQERATAMLAKAKNQLSDLDNIRKLVTNLEIYTGRGVDVLPLVAGEPAPADAPLVIYQDLLSFDEELLLHLDQGGIDHTMLKAVGQALGDATLVRQMIPSPRGMVLVRFRGGFKEFAGPRDGDSPEREMAINRFNEAMSRESMRHHLLYRDGASLTLISCDEVLPNIEQLLPSAAEQSSHYTRKHYDWDTRAYVYDPITREDIDYAKAQRSHLGRLTDFARVLIILWGLHDRTGLLSHTSIPRFSNWLDPGFQQTYLRLVSLDSLLGEERPLFREYRASINHFLGAGVTVAVRLDDAMDKSTAPGCYVYSQRSGDYECVWVPKERVVIARVTLHRGKPCITVETVHQWDKARRGKKVRVQLNHGFLVLDRADSAELAFYLGSRANRRDYAEYVSVFRMAHAHVSARVVVEEPWSTWLVRAIADGNLPGNSERISAACKKALAVVRAGTPGGALPATPVAAPAAMRKAALNAAHVALSDHGDRVAAVEVLCEEHGWIPVALVHDGQDRWHLYRECTAAERDSRIGDFPWTILARLAFNSTGTVTAADEAHELYRHRPGAQTIHAWENADRWRKAEAPGGVTHARLLSILESPVATTAQLSAPAGMVDELIDAAKEYNRTHTPGYVSRLECLFPAGSVIRGGKTELLALHVDALRAAYAWGDDLQRGVVQAWIRGTYAHPESHLESLEQPLRLLPVSVQPSHIPVKQKHPWIEARYAHVQSEEEWRQTRTTKTGEPYLRLTGLGTAGARLVPWLVPYLHGFDSRE